MIFASISAFGIFLLVLLGIIVWVVSMGIFSGPFGYSDEAFIPCGICSLLIAGIAIFVAIKLFGSVGNDEPKTVDAAYENLINEHTSEPEEIRNYRKQLMKENGKAMLEKKAAIKKELEGKMNESLAKWRKEVEAKYRAEYEAKATNITKNASEVAKKRAEYDKKHKKSSSNQTISIGNSVIDVQVNGKRIVIDNEGVHQY